MFRKKWPWVVGLIVVASIAGGAYARSKQPKGTLVTAENIQKQMNEAQVKLDSIEVEGRAGGAGSGESDRMRARSSPVHAWAPPSQAASRGRIRMATVRYLVRDVDAAVGFYNRYLGFVTEERFGTAMAIIRRGDLRLWLAGPVASASQPLPDGRTPEPGGWNRMVIEVVGLEDLRAAIVAANVAGAKGALDGAQQSYTIAANDQIRAADSYRNIVIAYRNRAPVLLRDVAEVVDDAENVRLAAQSRWLMKIGRAHV